jgi:hypothetical protein
LLSKLSFELAPLSNFAFKLAPLQEGGAGGVLSHGGAVQVDPIKPELKTLLVSALETKM